MSLKERDKRERERDKRERDRQIAIERSKTPDILREMFYASDILDVIEHKDDFDHSDLEGAIGAIVHQIIQETRSQG